MACYMCSQMFHEKRRALCTSCAKASLYEYRVRYLSSLLDRPNYQAEAILRPGNDGVLAALPQDADWDTIANGIKKEATTRLSNERLLVEERSKRLGGCIRQLTSDVFSLRDQVKTTRDTLRQRRSHLDQDTESLVTRRTDVEPLDVDFRKTRNRLQRVHSRTADARASLCCTTALLAGLRQELDRRKPTGRVLLGGLPVPDLRELGMQARLPSTQDDDAEELGEKQRLATNACMDNICRLILIWAHYLSVSLPSEVILPHNDVPHSAILPLKSSYKVKQKPSHISQSGRAENPTASREPSQGPNMARPRQLYLERPLSTLAKQDPKTFGLYVEGVTLLAWNIAWLCKSQGLAAINTFDEVCDIGRNLWLFYRMAESRVAEASTVPARRKMSSPPTEAIQTPGFGIMSHGSLQHSLSGHEGANLMHSWRLLQPHRLVDKLRLFLLNELTGAEWDVLSEHDLDEDREHDAPVLVGRSRRPRRDLDLDMSIMSVHTDDMLDGKSVRGKGWTKVRERPGDEGRST